MKTQAQFAVPDANLIPVLDYPQHMMDIPTSRMFIISKALKTYRDAMGANAVTYDASQGDGGQSLPGVPRDVLERALEIQIASGTGYDSPAGSVAFRQAVAETYWNIDPATQWGPANVVATQGGRDALNKAYSAMINCGYGRVGDALIVSAVPWISYNWGPYGVGLNVLNAPGDPAEAWTFTEDGLHEAVAFAEKAGRKVAGLLITSPDNPTGRTMSLERQIELAQTALQLGVGFVLFDWIYHWVSADEPHDVNVVLNAFDEKDRNRLMFLDGITKSLGGSNIRNCHLLASPEVCKFITSRSSHGVIVSLFSQAVAIAAYEKGFGEVARVINEPTNASRAVLNQHIADKKLNAITGNGYYAFIDVGQWLNQAGLSSSEDLGQILAEQHGVAVVPGKYFSDEGNNWIRFSYALPPEITDKAFQRFYEGLQSLVKVNA